MRPDAWVLLFKPAPSIHPQGGVTQENLQIQSECSAALAKVSNFTQHLKKKKNPLEATYLI